MRVFVYEFITGGGLYALPDAPAPSGSLLTEGAMMRSTIADQLQESGSEVLLLRDQRLDSHNASQGVEMLVDSPASERAAFFAACEQADAVLVIAPEFGGLLLDRVRWAESTPTPLISPNSDFVAMAGDKWATYQSWLQAGVMTPLTWLTSDFVSSGSPVDAPVLRKPIAGAGSLDINFVDFEEKFAPSSSTITQVYCDGLHASVGLLSNGSELISLPPGGQKIDLSKGFQYNGGFWPLSDELAERAKRLAKQAVAALPAFRGYIGVDMILGAKDGEDFAIEINPRLTTSYYGLCRLCRGNLSQEMLKFAGGESIELEFSNEAYQFHL
ncbi:MAG: ATP-grasp domain-containing protein [Blastopirellula sp. JB062]